MDATEIRLDGNNLTDVDSQSFIGRKRVTSLYLNNSQVIFKHISQYPEPKFNKSEKVRVEAIAE